MLHRLDSLTDREREVLRLLLVGHDAKSIAGQLGLSVHTINERLRTTRRKLGVSSSREAARLLAEGEDATYNSVGDKQLGVSTASNKMASLKQTDPSAGSPYRLIWLTGGMFIMSVLIAATILGFVLQGQNSSDQDARQTLSGAAGASQAAGLAQARAWIALLDGERWKESWDEAATPFRTQIDADQWAGQATEVRQPLGAVVSRTFSSVSKATSLPGAPNGRYEIIQFQTDFANKRGAIETVVMSYAADRWKVAGYFIR